MIITEKVNRTRYTLKDILSDEWKMDGVPDYSNLEIEKMYNVQTSSLLSMGVASACNFTVSHKHIPSHKLHIVYFQFPEIGKTSSKVTKSICDKIHNLYKNKDIQFEDSLFILLNEPVSESLESNFNSLNITLQNEYETVPMSDDIIQEMQTSKFPLEKRHFRNVRVFDINLFVNNILNHSLVPKHIVIRTKKGIEEILKKHNCTIHQLPIILKNDNIAKILRITPGDLCSIERKSRKSGTYQFYRICK
jgi:DNA-directed RNA polymerase subunit H (RpoH/RPB5)